MNRRLHLLIVTFITILSSVVSSQDKETAALLSRLDQLKKEFTENQNQLQRTIAGRWEGREKEVKQKDKNKEGQEQLRLDIERMYADVARAREMMLARENALESEKELVKQKEQDWDFVAQSIVDKREKESDRILKSFPIDLEERLEMFNAIETTYPGKKDPYNKLRALLNVKLQTLSSGSQIAISKRTIVVDKDNPITAQILRIGNSMAFGMDSEGKSYYLGMTGGAAINPFEWKQVTTVDISKIITDEMPTIMTSSKVQRALPIDVLQSQYSGILISGEIQTKSTAVKNFLIGGGPVLFPMALLLLWAISLTFNRFAAYVARRKKEEKSAVTALDLINQNKLEQLKTIVSRDKTTIASITTSCLFENNATRAAAEESIKEVLLTDVPLLDKHLNTIAVLAAAAPLMGLFGTVTGMIRMFDSITRFGTADPKLLAGGISEALITTEVGLAIAIPLILVHNFLRNRRNEIQENIEMYAIRILNRIWPEKV